MWCFFLLSIAFGENRKSLSVWNLQAFAFLCLAFQWSWRESNPRPNKEPIGFLHAYPFLFFRITAGKRRPIVTLSPYFHHCPGAWQWLSPY